MKIKLIGGCRDGDIEIIHGLDIIKSDSMFSEYASLVNNYDIPEEFKYVTKDKEGIFESYYTVNISTHTATYNEDMSGYKI